MSLAFTYTDARLDGDTESADPESIFSGGEDGNRVPYIPEYQLNAQVGVEYDKAGLFFTGTYVPATYSTASNTSQPINPDGTPDARFGKTDSYFLLDVTARYRFREQATLFAGIRNLLDREYVASRHPHGPRPGLPRVFNVGVEVAF
jgi:Fe(3+) dicitrate transport protein